MLIQANNSVGGGSISGEVAEIHVLAKYGEYSGIQVFANDSTDIVRSTSADVTGDYLRFVNSSYSVYAVKHCKVSYKVENDPWVTAEYNANDLIVSKLFSAMEINKSVVVVAYDD